RTVLMRAMGPFPEERYASLKELRHHLERYAEGRTDETPPKPRRGPLRGLPPTPADLLFGSVEDSIPTMVHHKLSPPPAREPEPRASEPAKGRSAKTRQIAERLGWVAIGAAGALAVSLIALPKFR